VADLQVLNPLLDLAQACCNVAGEPVLGIRSHQASSFASSQAIDFLAGFNLAGFPATPAALLSLASEIH
jgi:hypothetical protein